MILVIEPLFHGFEHVEVNSALVTSLRLAFPYESITFAGENGHINQVQARLAVVGVTGVAFHALAPAHRGKKPVGTVLPFIINLTAAETLAHQVKATRILFCSTTLGMLMAMRHAACRLAVPVATVVHGCSHRLTALASHGIAALFFRSLLTRLLAGDTLFRPIVLGSFIQSSYYRLLPELVGKLHAINHPYIFTQTSYRRDSKDEPIRFGTFGIGHSSKGTEDFFQLASELPNAQFVHIGPLLDITAPHYPNIQFPAIDRFLSREEIEHFAQKIDYALFFYNKNSYRFSASGAFLDAVSYIKPVIALHNPCFDHYFAQMGDIGYLCNDYAEIKQTVTRILQGTELKRYEFQTGRLLAGRSIFNPEQIAKQLQAIIVD